MWCIRLDIENGLFLKPVVLEFSFRIELELYYFCQLVGSLVEACK